MGLRELVAENKRSAGMAGGLLFVIASACIVYQLTLGAGTPVALPPPVPDESEDELPMAPATQRAGSTRAATEPGSPG